MPEPIVTLRDIVSDWLKSHGYDGLFNGDGNCACLLSDLFPCGDPRDDCEAGYRVPCDGTCESGKCDWHISRTKEAPDA